MRLLVILLVVGVVIWWVSRSRVVAGEDEDDVESKLLHLCLGDRALAERLIADELRRTPRLSRAQAADRAYEQLRRAKG